MRQVRVQDELRYSTKKAECSTACSRIKAVPESFAYELFFPISSNIFAIHIHPVVAKAAHNGRQDVSIRSQFLPMGIVKVWQWTRNTGYHWVLVPGVAPPT